MKLCITAAGNDLSAPTDASFGRAPWFIFIDTDSQATEAVLNASINAGHGAGIAAAQTMSDHGVEAVLTGRLGPKAQNALGAAEIGMYEGLGQGTVQAALEQFRTGAYAPTQKGSGQGQRCGSGAGKGQGKGRLR